MCKNIYFSSNIKIPVFKFKTKISKTESQTGVRYSSITLLNKRGFNFILKWNFKKIFFVSSSMIKAMSSVINKSKGDNSFDVYC